jgi:nitroimidazol reductase NimA-like FMN-containing flavoprotein (pyridoxamine 5'-phosphate oxidase superfamily)
MITEDRTIIESIIRDSLVCRLALSVDDRPYIIPLNFGYEKNALYFHGLRREGKCLEMIRRNRNVCFEIDTGLETVPAEQACKWSMKYRSVIGFGTASIVEETDARKKALDVIMRQYGDREYTYDDKIVELTVVVRLEITSMTGKESGYGDS